MRGRTQGRRRLARERGQALVEMVMILPVFLAVVFGAIEIGKGFNYWIDMTHLANEGARYAAVNRWPDCPALDTGACTPQLREYLRLRANTGELGDGEGSNVGGNGLGPGTGDSSYTTADAPNAADGIIICFPEGGTPEVGEAVKVIVSADYTLAVVDGLLDAIGLDDVGEIEVSASATMRLERSPTGNRVLAEDLASCPT